MADVQRTEGQRDEGRLHFLDYWRIVKKRKEIIIATLIIIVFTTAVFSWIAKPIYSASSQIKVEQRIREMDVFRTEPSRYLPFDQYEFETHRKGLEWDGVLRKVVLGEIYGNAYRWRCPVHPTRPGERGLTDDQVAAQKFKCNAPLAGGGACGAPLIQVRELKYPDWEPLHIKWAKRDAYPGGQYQVDGAVSTLRRNLRIRPEKGTRLITIRYESHDQKEAQLIPDMVAEAYIQWKEEQRGTSLQSTVTDLERQIRNYQFGGPGQSRSLEEDEAELIRMRQQFTLDTQGELTQKRDLAQFKSQKNAVEADIAKSKSYLDILNAGTNEERINAAQDSAAVLQLSADLGKWEAELKSLLEEYGLEHPDVMKQKAKVTNLRQTLNTLANGILTARKAELASFEAQASKLDTIIKDLEKVIHESEKAYSDYQAFNAWVEIRRGMLRDMQGKLTEEKITNALPTVDIQIVQWAQFPLSPVRPRRIFNVFVSLFVGLTLGTGLAYFVEYLDTSMKNVDDVERYLGMSLLGVIPKQRGELLTDLSPKSHAAEAYRMVWTNVEFARRDSKFKSIMVTSGGVAEGKTTTVVNLGIAVAQMGRKALVVDSDLRRPKIHKLLRCPNRVGLSDILLREADPHEVVMKSDIPGLWVLPSGKRPTNVIGLLNSQKMRDLVATLTQDFEVVFYDSPPVMGVSDASVLASIVDRVLLVIDFRKYPRNVAMRAKRILENVGGKVVGGLLNKMTTMGGDYYYYYSQAYHHYYSASEEEETEEEKTVQTAQGKESKEV